MRPIATSGKAHGRRFCIRADLDDADICAEPFAAHRVDGQMVFAAIFECLEPGTYYAFADESYAHALIIQPGRTTKVYWDR